MKKHKRVTTKSKSSFINSTSIPNGNEVTICKPTLLPKGIIAHCGGGINIGKDIILNQTQTITFKRKKVIVQK